MFCVGVRAGAQYQPGQAPQTGTTTSHRSTSTGRCSLEKCFPSPIPAICAQFVLTSLWLSGGLLAEGQKKRTGVLSGYKSHFSFAKPVQHSGENQGSRDENSVLKVRLVEKLKLSWFWFPWRIAGTAAVQGHLPFHSAISLYFKINVGFEILPGFVLWHWAVHLWASPSLPTCAKWNL